MLHPDQNFDASDYRVLFNDWNDPQCQELGSPFGDGELNLKTERVTASHDYYYNRSHLILVSPETLVYNYWTLGSLHLDIHLYHVRQYWEGPKRDSGSAGFPSSADWPGCSQVSADSYLAATNSLEILHKMGLKVRSWTKNSLCLELRRSVGNEN